VAGRETPVEKPRIAVVGAGAWGRNHVRTFAQLGSCELVALCDRDEKVLVSYEESLPGVAKFRDLEELLGGPALDGVVIAAQAVAHAPLAMRCLEAGLDVLVEKPLAMSSREALRLCETAAGRGRILMVGHLLLYHPGVRKMLEIVRAGELGEIRYVTAKRVNLGTVRRDENALWSLAPHDLSVVQEILGEGPLTVSARGAAYLRPGIEDVVFLTLRYPGDRLAHVHVSWLDPHKERRMTLVGSQKMLSFDDMEVQEKIRIYDKGVAPTGFLTYDETLRLRQGDILIPRIEMVEPLRLEAEHFVDCIRQRRQPLTDGWSGYRVVRLLEAAQTSLAEDGAPVPCEEV
jgi:predicted dehydrogenase